MSWELIEVTGERDCTMDNSGVYTVINHTSDHKVRVDLMTNDDQPIISWQSNNVDALRKEIMLVLGLHDISVEHASYIGAEIVRCGLMASAYTQN
jgi:hypothetical protein